MLRLLKKPFFFVSMFLLVQFAYAQPVNNLFRNASDPVVGNPKGNVTVVEFFDYQCSHCISMAPVIAKALRSNPNLRVVFKELPIRGPGSELAARAALAANLQHKYYPFNHALLNSNEQLNEAVIFKIAKQSGLDVVKLKKDMSSKRITAQIGYNFQLAQKYKLTGTPTFFIGKTNASDSNQIKYVLGEMNQQELQSAIRKAE